jgi:glyoxylase-like metal-dependent hydrolase (beta-lactamase superfamily II)
MTEDWTAPTVDEVAAGVFRIPLPLPTDGLRAVNVYALASAEGLALVDGGWAISEGRTALERGLRRIGLGLADIERFLVTHVHRDHYTLAVQLRTEFGGHVALGAGERPSLDELTDPAHEPMVRQVTILRRCGATALADELAATAARSRPSNAVWEMPDEWLRDGEQIIHGHRRLEVIATPGHTPGHVVFYDTPGRLLFAGDHVLPTITPSIGLAPVTVDNPLADFLHSLAKVRSRPDSVLLPAHGPVASSAHKRVDQLAEHHTQRLDAAESAIVHQGACTAYDVAKFLRWTKRQRELHDLDLFNRMLAVIETEAHLVFLAAQHRLKVGEHNGRRTYAPT